MICQRMISTILSADTKRHFVCVTVMQVPSGQSHTFALTLPLKYGAVTKLFMGAYPFVILTGMKRD